MLGFSSIGRRSIGSAASVPQAATPTVTGVTLNPQFPTVAGGTTRQFTTSVLGTNNPSQGVTLSATGGNINGAGLFTAPQTSSVDQVITVTARSDLDPTFFASTTVLVPAAVVSTVTGVTVTPPSATVIIGDTIDFDWLVEGTNNPSQSVTLAVDLGEIDSDGHYTAPLLGGTDTLTVTSDQDPDFSATVQIEISATAVSRTFAVQLGTSGGVAANLGGLSISFYDEALPHLATVARYQNGSAATNSTGTLSWSCLSTLEVGESGHVTIYGPSGVHYNGPVQAA